MPQYTSVRPVNESSPSAQEIDPGNVNISQAERRISERSSESGPGASNYPHMTLDGRRRPKANGHNTRNNGQEHWNDVTSTWRKMGTKGHSQPVTMTGTITRGKKKGQVVDVQLDLTDRELMEISTMRQPSHESVVDSSGSLPSSGLPAKTGCRCGLNDGPHVLILSIIAFPFILVASLFASFYFGALTWQNIFTHFYDERTIWHRIFLCPLLVITFPLFIVLFTLGIAIYAAFVQLRWSFMDWKDEVGSLEKGFYGWLCGKLNLEDCCPYTVVELFDSTEEGDGHHGTAQSTMENGATGGAGDSGRVAVVYTERQGQSSRDRSQDGQRQRASLPSSGQGHVPMHQMESTM